jgi:hypothetical protein
MGGLYLVESRQWRALSPMGSSAAQGSTWIVSYAFEYRVT